MPGAVSVDPASADLAPIGHVLAKHRGLFPVDVLHFLLAERAGLGPASAPEVLASSLCFGVVGALSRHSCLLSGPSLERRLIGAVVIPGHRARRPGVFVRVLVARPVATLTLCLVHGGSRPAQGGADLVDLHFDHRSLLALVCLPAALLETAGDDDPHPLLQGLGHGFRLLSPDRATEEAG